MCVASVNRTHLFQFYTLGVFVLAAPLIFFMNYSYMTSYTSGHLIASQRDTIPLIPKYSLALKENLTNRTLAKDMIEETRINQRDILENYVRSLTQHNRSHKDMNDSIKNLHVKLLPTFKKDPSKVIYNRIPKCGSTTMLILIMQLHKMNQFLYQTSGAYHKYTFNKSEEFEFVHQITTINQPMVFDKHTYFVDFSEYGLPMPLYMNMIRDPVEHAVSMYYYNRRHSANMQLQYTAEELNMTLEECIDQHSDDLAYCDITHDMYTLWFCGNNEACSNNRTYAMQTVRKNIEKHYTFIGLTEYYTESVIMLEKLIPHFFNGSMILYTQQRVKLRNSKRTMKIQPSESTKVFIKFKLSDAYEIYNFVQQRFFHLKSKMNL